ncbi:MAG: hypothetical protein Fur0021_15580 [Candidatus Promineifilaceae bacterium]
MKFGEMIIRLCGGGALGAVVGVILATAPLALARILATILSVVILLLVGVFLFGLEQKRRLAAVIILTILAFVILLNQTVPRRVWQGVLFVADALARLLLSTRGQNASETIVTWIVLGATVNLLFGAIDLDAWRRANR